MAPSATSPPPEILGKTPPPAYHDGTVDNFSASTVTVDQVVQSLIRNGGCFVRGLLNPEELRTIESDVRPYIEGDREWEGEFFPRETRRVCGLAGKSPTFIKAISSNHIYREVCDILLSDSITAWSGLTTETSISKPQINATTVFSIGPGARAQDLHRDDIIHHNKNVRTTASEYKYGRDTAIGIFVAGKKTTRQNGATRFVPGSHLQASEEPPVEENAVYAELNPGDAFIMLASCYHGGSANTTENEERLLYGTFMTKGFLRQVWLTILLVQFFFSNIVTGGKSVSCCSDIEN